MCDIIGSICSGYISLWLRGCVSATVIPNCDDKVAGLRLFEVTSILFANLFYPAWKKFLGVRHFSNPQSKTKFVRSKWSSSELADPAVYVLMFIYFISNMPWFVTNWFDTWKEKLLIVQFYWISFCLKTSQYLVFLSSLSLDTKRIKVISWVIDFLGKNQ